VKERREKERGNFSGGEKLLSVLKERKSLARGGGGERGLYHKEGGWDREPF